MLRTRLMSGLVCLLIILLSMGLYSINQCSQLGKRIKAISQENNRAGRSIDRVKRSAASMTGALLVLATGDQQRSLEDYEAASQSFQGGLDEELSRKVASPKEKALIKKLNETFQSYNAQARAFLKVPEDAGPEWHATAARLGKDTAQLLDLADQLSVAHQTELSEGDKLSGDDINNTIRLMILLMIIALVATLMAYIGLSRGLLNPLKSLASSIRDVGEGKLDQNVPVLSEDELGVLALSFNKMAAQLRTYRSNTSEELMRLNLTIRSTLASFPDPIFVLNSQGAVELRNPEADQLAMKLLFSGITRLPEKIDEKVEQVRASGEDYLPTLFSEAVKFYIDGQARYFLPRIVLLRDDQKQVFGVAVILENVTRMLLLDDVKSNLIATVSHELKTPLTTVRMALYLLLEKTVGSLNEKQTDLVSTAREDADRLLQTLNDLLDLAKLEHGSSQLHLTDVAASELVEASVRNAREIAHAEEMSIQTEISPDLPAVHIDRQRIMYVFTNFLTNAIKYSPKGSAIMVRATMGATRAGEVSVRFSVADKGPGISPENQEHVFERFYRVPGTTKTGAGLGLSIAREIVVAHHGEIGVISRLGEGSEFFFVLPLTVSSKISPENPA